MDLEQYYEKVSAGLVALGYQEKPEKEDVANFHARGFGVGQAVGKLAEAWGEPE